MKRMVLFFSAAVCLLSATWTGVTAQKADIRNFYGVADFRQGTITLNWWAVGDASFVSQILEHSTDGRSFTPIAEIPVIGGGAGQYYSYLHSTPVSGKNYYRIGLVFDSGNRLNSQTIRVDLTQPIFRPNTGSTRPRG